MLFWDKEHNTAYTSHSFHPGYLLCELANRDALCFQNEHVLPAEYPYTWPKKAPEENDLDNKIIIKVPFLGYLMIKSYVIPLIKL